MLAFHPYANLFPLIEGAAFDELVADIRANGLIEPIIVLDDMILDGRNRYRAAVAAGVLDAGDEAAAARGYSARQFRQFVEAVQGDPLAWVLSKNLHRRHLSDSQRTLIAAEIARMRPGRPSVKADHSTGDVADEKPASWRDSAVRQGEAAQLLNVSERSVQRGRQVIEHAAPEVVDAVRRGEVAISAAAVLSELPVTEQLRIMRSADPRAVSRLVRERRAVETEVKAERRAERERELGEQQRELPQGKRYGVILADPEWKFMVRSVAGMDRAADNHYPTSDIDVIKAREVATIAADDCVLFLWATVPFLQQALDVMAAWGFTYKTNFEWRKDRIGTGYWSRNRHEHLLVGVRGEVPAPAMGTQYESSIEAAVGAHSAKPEKFYELIEAYFPSLPKIELNARARRAGWEAWGLEAPDAPEPHPQAAVDADIEADEQIELGAAVDANTIIREGYARNAPLAELMAATGLGLSAIKMRAARMGLSDRSRQRAAVAQANRRRTGAPQPKEQEA